MLTYMFVPTLILLLTLIITPIVIPILITKLTLTLIIMVRIIDCILFILLAIRIPRHWLCYSISPISKAVSRERLNQLLATVSQHNVAH